MKKYYAAYLQKLVDNRSSITKEYNEKERKYLTNHRGISGINLKSKAFCYTPIAKACQGAQIEDMDEHAYDDISMGFGVHLFGHHPEFITHALEKANQAAWGLGPYHESMFDLANKLAKLTGMERFSFFNSGTEAIMVAIRLARAYTNKSKIVVFKGAYHGHNDATLVFKTNPMTGQPLALIPGIPASSQADTYLLDFDDEASLTFIETHADEIAAVLNEPVQSRNPACQPKEFHQKLRQITQVHNIALIFDEMITGFRIHPKGAQAYFEVEADMVTYGKVIGGGMPIGIVGGKAEYLDLIDGGQWQYGDESLPHAKRTFVAGTFCNHPLTMAAANAVVDVMLEKGEQICQQLNQQTDDFVEEVNAWMHAAEIPIRLSNFGSLFRIETPSTAKFYFHQLVLEGLYIWEGKTCFLSTAHTPEVLERIKKKFKKCAITLKAFGYFPSKSPTDLSKTVLEKDLPPVPFNLGTQLAVKGHLKVDTLQIAFRYLQLATQLIYSGLAEGLTICSANDVDDTSAFFEQFINQDLTTAIALSVIEEKGFAKQVAFMTNRKFLDAWALAMWIDQLFQTYDALTQGKPLPDYEGWGASKNVSALPEPAYFYLKEQESFSIPRSFSQLRKVAKSHKTQSLAFLMGAMAWAFQKNIAHDREALHVGNPVTTRIKAGNGREQGNETALQITTYTKFDTFENCLKSAHQTQESCDVVFNLDRIVSRTKFPDFAITPKPLDPKLMRYLFVVNVLGGNGLPNLWVDVKSAHTQFKPADIQGFIRDFNRLIQQSYATA
ncbi:MAG: aspartate aminotransferase family protein [Flammeovirgaceae bacterium]